MDWKAKLSNTTGAIEGRVCSWDDGGICGEGHVESLDEVTSYSDRHRRHDGRKSLWPLHGLQRSLQHDAQHRMW
jgi:hypothetical protein